MPCDNNQLRTSFIKEVNLEKQYLTIMRTLKYNWEYVQEEKLLTSNILQWNSQSLL